MEPQGKRTASLALVVDDDGFVRMIVREALEQSGLEVCEAEHGEQALALFAASRPDIVVLDVMMPGLDGFATCAELRGSVGGSRVPILIMTGLDDAESITMRNVDASIIMLTTLKAMGVQLSIDDFGTDYSSLTYLQRLPIDMVKIDQSFIREILTQAGPVPIVRAIIAMAHSLRLFVLAEGIEQEAQRSLLLEQGCDQAQGYLFGPPMSADAFASLLPPVHLRKAS